jgi:putative tricarboxylic transport membrane protein
VTDYAAALTIALGNLLSFPNIFIPVLGMLVAMVASFLPGIGNASLAALMLVATLTWDPVSVLLLFGALTGGATFMGSITAILFNIPGNASSAAVLLDGHPMARNGEARTAIACAATASAVGSVFGVMVLLALLPIVQPFLLEFGPLERLLLGLWGLITIIAIPNTSALRALAVTALGLLCAMIGADPTSGLPRWTFGSLQLTDGLGTIAVLLGFFTLSEIIGWRMSHSIEGVRTDRSSGSTLRGIAAVFRHWGLTLRSSVIGTIIGIIPGVGGTMASFVAYGQAVQTARDPERFGTGDIRGVVAPEAAVDSKDGGSLLPVLAFGLPGSEAGVILVTVLAIHGLVPGTPMLTTDLSLSLTLIFALLMANILTSVIGVALSPMLSRLTRLRIDRIALPALIASLVTIVQLNGFLADLYVAVFFGILGYLFKRLDWPRVPFIIAFILGGFIETNLALSSRLMSVGRLSLWDRPAAMVILAIILVSLLWLGRRRTRRMAAAPVARGVADLWLASVLGLVCLCFGIAALVDGALYTTYALAMAWGAALIFGAVMLSSVRARALPGAARAGIPAAHVVPLALMAGVPVATWLIGLGPAMGGLTWLWLRHVSAERRRSVAVTLLWAIVVAATVTVATGQMSRMRLPEPALLDAVRSILGA